MGKALILTLTVALILLWSAPLPAQISPGVLSRAHAALDGPLNCANCHKFGAGRPELKCSSCHSEIQKELSEKHGYHARIVDVSKGDSDCSRCHAEHAGRGFALIRWPTPPDPFDHRAQTGFALEGRHTSLACAQCHSAKNVANRGSIQMKDLNRTFLGLDRSCVSCHSDPHGGQLSRSCESCHSSDSWKSVRFNHDNARFQLTGRHAAVACDSCHPKSASDGAVRRFRNIAFTNCTNCHRDPHAGKFAEACTQCHSTAGWRTLKMSDNHFDHDETRYPLRGLHAKVACAACHKNSDFTTPLRSTSCTDCHADRHNGQFSARSDRGDCVSCHTVNGFKPATFSVEQHSQTKYPLLSSHLKVDCAQCHEPKGDKTNYHPLASNCSDCHKDSHEGQFAAAPLSNRCESCHSLAGFKTSTFGLMRHNEARFVLAGAHAATPCVECHRDKPSSHDRQYRFADLSCKSCHPSPHGQELVNGTGCESCHTDSSWSKTSAFNHASTTFELVGAHRSATCASCHRSNTADEKLRTIPFRGVARSCNGCHEDVHAGQFKQGNVTDCATCHGPTAWRPSTFDHEKTQFQLTGSHRTVRCQDCHQTQEIGGRSIRMYSLAKKDCATCH